MDTLYLCSQERLFMTHFTCAHVSRLVCAHVSNALYLSSRDTLYWGGGFRFHSKTELISVLNVTVREGTEHFHFTWTPDNIKPPHVHHTQRGGASCRSRCLLLHLTSLWCELLFRLNATTGWWVGVRNIPSVFHHKRYMCVCVTDIMNV